MIGRNCGVVAAEFERAKSGLNTAIVLVDLVAIGLRFDFDAGEECQAIVSDQFSVDMEFTIAKDANAILRTIVRKGGAKMVVAGDLGAPFSRMAEGAANAKVAAAQRNGRIVRFLDLGEGLARFTPAA